MDYTKTITPHFATIGRRQKLTGYIGEIHDGAVLLHSMEYANYSQAETALNAITYDLLTDLAERGLSDTAPMMAEECKMNVLGTRWTVCGAPADGPCYCDVVVIAASLAERGLRDTAPMCATCGNDDIGGCPDCGAPLLDMPILDDVARVLDMALGATHGAASVVAELRRVRARIGQVQGCEAGMHYSIA